MSSAPARNQVMSKGGMFGGALTILNSAIPNAFPNPTGLVSYTPPGGANASTMNRQQPRRARAQTPTMGLPAPIDYSSQTF